MGKLYICATPIGNLEDVSIRLLKTLRNVDVIACEDTRQTLKLLNRYKIRKKLLSYHQHSQKSREDLVLEQLQQGKKVALVSDSGMPAISDPGAGLIQRAIEAGVAIEVIPGPSALTAALVLSGLDSTAFIFEGFLSASPQKRRKKLQALKEESRTLVLYEAPHRLASHLKDLEEIMGPDREIAIVREISKIHEEVQRGPVSAVRRHFEIQSPRGEICMVIAGQKAAPPVVDLEQIAREIDRLLEKGWKKNEAFKIKAREYHISKSQIYQYYLQQEERD